MNQAVNPDTQAIVVDDVFPHAPAVIWKALTSGELIGRWLMAPTGFEPAVGSHFTFQTKPAGEWDGTIHCEVLEVVPNERLSYAWKGGHEGNDGYGSKLETVVTFTISTAETGTRLRLTHSGFVLPKNDTAYRNMSEGWKKVVKNLDRVVAEEAALKQQENDMNTPYTGGCACGEIRYEISSEPAVMVDCQCRQCQRDSGTGHQSHLTFVAAEVKVEGEASHWQTVGDGGTVKRRAFCPTCGSSVHMTFPDMPDVFIVTPASLDDPSRYKPQLVSWTAAGHAWDHLDPALPKFDKMPTT